MFYTVKLAHVQSPAEAAGKVQLKFSASNDFLRFPQVTGGNFPAPANKLREASIVHARTELFIG